MGTTPILGRVRECIKAEGSMNSEILLKPLNQLMTAPDDYIRNHGEHLFGVIGGYSHYIIQVQISTFLQGLNGRGFVKIRIRQQLIS
jgi:hypothetical protein